MLNPVQTGIGGKHPTGKEPFDLAVKLVLIDNHKGRCFGLFGDGPCVTDLCSHHQGTKANRLIDGSFKRSDLRRHLVKRRKHRNGITDFGGFNRLRPAKPQNGKGKNHNRQSAFWFQRARADFHYWS